MKSFRLHHGPTLLACLAALLSAAAGNGLILVDEPVGESPVVDRMPHPPHWHLPPRPIHRHMPLALERQQVEIEIRDQVATTSVVQVFKNETSSRFEGTFVFPIPADAHVNTFAMEVNGKMVEAELLDEGKARQIYEDIVRRVCDPALFEYAGRQLFKVRIFPIEPHSTKEVRIRYSELLTRDGGLVRYSYPLDTAKYCPRPIPDFSMKIDVRSGRDRVLKTIYSPSHEVEVNRKDKHHAVLGLEADKIDPTRDFTLYLSHKRRDGGPVDLDFLTWHEDGRSQPGHFMLLVSPEAWDDATRAVPKDVVFVFDSSGSMQGEKMKQAKAAMKFCIDALNPDDRFEVVRFSTEAEPVFEQLVRADAANRDQALRFVDSVRPIGGTAIEEALTLAMETACERAEKSRPVQILFLTDGKPTLGATDQEQILRAVEKARGDTRATVRVFCFGIGTEVNTHLLDLVAERTRGASEYVLPDEDIERKVSGFFAKVSDPVLTDLDLEIDGVEWVRERYPKHLPDLFRGEQLVVFGRYQPGPRKGEVVLRGSIGGETKTFKTPVTFGGGGADHSFIAQLWATRRVGYLLDQIRLHGESGELKDEVATLARKYGIVTPYTSYLIVEDEERREVPTAFQTLPRPAASPESAPGEPADFRASFADLSDEYDALRRDKDGDSAVAGSATAKLLKESTGFGGLTEANREGDRARGRELSLVPSRRIEGKTFYQHGDLWIDEATQALPADARQRQVRFGSDEYFQLLSEHPHLAQWLSIGTRVKIEVAGELIEILP